MLRLLLSLTFVLISILPLPALELTVNHIDMVEQGFYNNHIRFLRTSPELSPRVAKQLIERFDAGKFYLLEKDVRDAEARLKDFPSMSSASKFRVITDLRENMVERITERLDHVRLFLADSFVFDTSTVLILDADKREWSKDTATANTNVEHYLQFQISNYLLSGLEMAEAKELTIKSYERALKRMKEFDPEDLIAFYLDAFATSLDPHSNFLAKDVLEDFQISMRLSLEGIGAQLTSKDGFTVIQMLIAGGAAERSGRLKPGDKIIAVGQGNEKAVNVIDMDLRDVVSKIRGKSGSEVRLTILRQDGSESTRFVLPLIRTKVNLEDQAAALHVFDRFTDGKTVQVGLLHLPSFYGDVGMGGRSCSADVVKLLKEAKQKNLAALVLDLSTNGGGSLDEAVKLAGLFFARGGVVSQKSRLLPSGSLVLEDRDEAMPWDGPLVVLTSRVSASASEIVAGALKDYDRALIVGGDHTYGKGSVQSMMPLAGQLGALKVTMALYYIPSGRTTQLDGVKAHITLPSAWSTDKMGERNLDFALPPDTVSVFLSAAANPATGPHFTPVNKVWIPELKKASDARVEASEKFAKVKEDIIKAERNAGEVKLADLWQDRQQLKAEGKDPERFMSREEMEREMLDRADIHEALSIAADLSVIISRETGKQDQK